MKQGGTASKTCEKHGHSALLQLSHSLLNFTFKELFPQIIGIQIISHYVVIWSWVLKSSLEDSFRAFLSPGYGKSPPTSLVLKPLFCRHLPRLCLNLFHLLSQVFHILDSLSYYLYFGKEEE